jgi:hypothetical protein
MGFRFRRTLSLAPGLRLNISRSGVSTSVGVRGAHVTIGHGNVRHTVGIPGSGLSYTTVNRLGGSRDTGSLAELIVVIFRVVQYLPLLVLYGAFIYGCYFAIKGWHPVLIVLTLMLFTWKFISNLGRFAELVSQDVAALIGGAFYGAGMVTWKVAHLPDLDWIWTAVLTVVCALIGAWSYYSCHAAMLRMPRSPSAASDEGRNRATGGETECVEKERMDSIAEKLHKSKELAQCQSMVAARLRDEGWDTRIVTAENKRGLVTAEYREKKVVILCSPTSIPVGDEAVYEIYSYRCKIAADYAVIASAAIYSSSELRLALGTRVLLMQFDQLNLLRDLIFSATALEPQLIFRVAGE